MKKNSLIFLLIILLASCKINNQTEELSSENSPLSSTNNLNSASVFIQEDGTQVIHVLALGGYRPEKILAKADLPTRLEMETKGTYDCSSSFVIPDLNIEKKLPPTGMTKIDLGAPSKDTKITGLCGMGMFTLEIVFQ